MLGVKYLTSSRQRSSGRTAIWQRERSETFKRFKKCFAGIHCLCVLSYASYTHIFAQPILQFRSPPIPSPPSSDLLPWLRCQGLLFTWFEASAR
jgi:hypothetical protein